jgi:hypothetical protein
MTNGKTGNGLWELVDKLCFSFWTTGYDMLQNLSIETIVSCAGTRNEARWRSTYSSKIR